MSTIDERHKALHKLRSTGIGIPHAAYSAVEKDVPGSEMRKWPWWSAIWSRPQASVWQFNEQELASAQGSWDESKRHVDAQTELAAEIEARKAKEADAARARAEQIAAEAREKLLIEPKRAYLAAGGDPATWDAIKDDVAADIAKQAAVNASKPHASGPVLPKSIYA